MSQQSSNVPKGPESNEPEKKGLISRAFHYVASKIQERAAPEIPVEDR